MNSHPNLSGRAVSLLSEKISKFLIVTLLTSMLSTSTFAETVNDQRLWLAHVNGVMKVSPSDEQIEANLYTDSAPVSIATDGTTGDLWIVEKGRITLAAGNGAKRWEKTIAFSNQSTKVFVFANSGYGWLLSGKLIAKFDRDGALISELALSENIVAATFDETRSRLWISTNQNKLLIIDSSFTELSRFSIQDAATLSMLYSKELDEVWLFENSSLFRRRASDGMLSWRFFGSFTGGNITFVDSDGDGGMWICLGASTLKRISRNGEIQQSISSNMERGCSGTARFDAIGQGIWLLGPQSLLKLSPNGAETFRWYVEVDGGRDNQFSMFTTAPANGLRPTLRLVSPLSGTFTNNPKPIVELEYQAGYTLDTDSIDILENNLSLDKICQADQTKASCFLSSQLANGAANMAATILDLNGEESNTDSVSFFVDAISPSVTISNPATNIVTNNPSLPLSGDVNEPIISLVLSQNGSLSSLDSVNGHFSAPLSLQTGTNTIKVIATDRAGNSGEAARVVELDVIPPNAPNTEAISFGALNSEGLVTVVGMSGSAEPGSVLTIVNVTTGSIVSVVVSPDGSFVAEIAALVGHMLRLTSTDYAGNTSGHAEVSIPDPNAEATPPEPSEIAPPLSDKHPTSLFDSTSFLYSGPRPVQYDVAEGVIKPEQVAVVKGRVLDRSGQPVAGVSVRIHGRIELGRTLTRANGRFDMVVNGGESLTVTFSKDGYLSSHRTISTSWQNYAIVDDVVLVTLDSNLNTVLPAASTMQLVRGTVSIDSAGSRQATLLIPPYTDATLTLQDGSVQTLQSMGIRATEYTVGSNGFESMPATLPRNSAYTYAVELSIDEAISAGAERVDFNQALPFYVENFLGFPIGRAVPAGYYDRDKANWVASENGRVVKILSIVDGIANLQVDNTGNIASQEQLSALGITVEELQKLASVYPVGASLWRTPITHFTPWDLNWPFWLPDDAELPPWLVRLVDLDSRNCKLNGCVISAQQQSLGENVSVIGTSMQLAYKSTRSDGFKASRAIDIELTDSTVPESLQGITLRIEVAGQVTEKSYLPSANLHERFEWDGMDAFGRKVHDISKANIQIQYQYPCAYNDGANGFGEYGATVDVIGTRDDCKSMMLSRDMYTLLVSPFLYDDQFGAAWELDRQHRWLPSQNVLLLGNGDVQYLADPVIRTMAGGGSSLGDGGQAKNSRLAGPNGIAFDAQGNLYVADSRAHRVRKISANGTISTVAGTGTKGSSGDGGQATLASLNYPADIAVDSAGNLYIADTENHKIRRVSVDGIIQTIAGLGSSGFAGDGGSAASAKLNYPSGVSVDANGNVYIADTFNQRIRRIGTNGHINTVAGKGSIGSGGDQGPALKASIAFPRGVEVDASGILYIADTYSSKVRRVDLDGVITTVAGTGSQGFSGDGGAGTSAKLFNPERISVDDAGNLYIADTYNHRIRRVDPSGVINTIAGTGLGLFGGDEGYATQATLTFPRGVAVDKNGNLHIADFDNNRVRSIGDTKRNDGEEKLIADDDGATIHVFNRDGLHLRTVDALTGKELVSFSRSQEGELVSIKEGEGHVTTVERDSNGHVHALVSANGRRTELFVNSTGDLTSISNEAGQVWKMQYHNGLLERFTNPRGYSNEFEYDGSGRLVIDRNAGNGGWSLARTEAGDSYEVSMTSAGGLTLGFSVNATEFGKEVREVMYPDGSTQSIEYSENGTQRLTAADGTVTTAKQTADPRFGLQSPLGGNASIVVPSGLRSETTHSRVVTLADRTDPLSHSVVTDRYTVNGRQFTNEYSTQSNSLTSKSPLGRISIAKFDGNGFVNHSQVGNLAPESRIYDDKGRLIEVRQGTEQVRRIQFEYGSDGLLSKLIDPLSRETTYEYDAAGRLVQTNLPTGQKVHYEYDAHGNLTAIQPPGSGKHVFSYNATDIMQTYSAPVVSGVGSAETTFEYNIDQDLQRVIRPDNKEILFTYNSNGQLDALNFTDGAYYYQYDDVTAQLTSLSSLDGSVLNYRYDGILPLEEEFAGVINGKVGFQYDANFHVTGVVLNGVNVSYGYDNDGLLTSVGELALSYDTVNGLLTGVALANVDTTYEHNEFGESTSSETTYNAESFARFDYAHDHLGRISEITENVLGTTIHHSFQYNEIGRLVSVERNGVTTTWSYDANGNRTHENGVNNASYDAQDRLLSLNAQTFEYGANGELAQLNNENGQTSFKYDAMGNLKQVILANGVVLDYIVDARNRRVGKKVNGVLVQGFLYQDQLKPIAQLDGTGNVIARFIYGSRGNVPDYLIKNGQKYRVVADHLGSPRLVINVSSGEVVQHLEYDVWGNIVSDTNPGFQPFGYAGGLYDSDTKLTRFGSRDYDARVGRWTAKDPVGFDGGDSNLYSYVANDPVNSIDPTGNYLVPILIGAGGGALADIGIQLLLNGGQIACINWGQVAFSAGLGAIGGSLSSLSKLSKLTNRTQSMLASGGNNLVYRAMNSAGDTIYVGITNNFSRRAAQHLADRGFRIRSIPGISNLSRSDARAVEQVLINLHGLTRNGGTLLNRINSISRFNPIYNSAIQRGTLILRGAGYPGI